MHIGAVHQGWCAYDMSDRRPCPSVSPANRCHNRLACLRNAQLHLHDAEHPRHRRPHSDCTPPTAAATAMCAVPADRSNDQPRHAATAPPALHSRYNPCHGRHYRTPMQQVHAWMPDGPLLALHAIPTVSGTAPALEFTRAAGSRGSTRLSSRRPGQQQPTATTHNSP